MHIFVINLITDTLRKESIEKQLNHLGLPYEIFPAVIGKNLTENEKKIHYDGVWFFRNEGREASDGELGCALSHIAIYQAIKERNLPYALIIEDDAWLNPNLPNILNVIEQQYSSNDCDVFLLTWTASTYGNFKRLWSSYNLIKVKTAFCTHGYVVSNAAASVLIDKLYPVAHVADCWVWLRRHRIVNLWSIFPTCITADLSYESQVAHGLKSIVVKRPYIQRITQKIHRAFWNGFDVLISKLR